MTTKTLKNSLPYMPIYVVLLLFLGCAPYPANQNPPAYKVMKPGQLIKLNESLTIPPDKAAVFIQFGKVIQPNTVDQWSPNCRIVVQGLSEDVRVIQPDEFAITRINYESILAAIEPIMVASRFMTGSAEEGGAIAEEYITSLFLKSDKQSFVKQLICKHWEDPHDGHHLTVKQIQQTLGKIIEIKESQE